MHRARPKQIDGFTLVDKDTFFLLLKADPRDVMPQRNTSKDSDGNTYTSWEEQYHRAEFGRSYNRPYGHPRGRGKDLYVVNSIAKAKQK